MLDYMDTPEEVTKNPQAKREFALIANGDPAVFNLLWSFWSFEHVWDDLIDSQKDLSEEKKEQMFKALHDFVTDLLVNPFVMQHRLELRALFVSAMTRCLDGDRMEREQNILAPAVRCGDVDVVAHIAYLHRGWEFLRQIGRIRTYDKPNEEKK